MSTPDQRAAEILAEALNISDQEVRRADLDRACGGNASLRQEVESLLAAHAEAGTYLDKRPTALLHEAGLVGPARRRPAPRTGNSGPPGIPLSSIEQEKETARAGSFRLSTGRPGL